MLTFLGGTLAPSPDAVSVGLTTAGDGRLALPSHFPPGVPPASVLFLQLWVADASAPFGAAGSNAVSGATN